MAKLHINKSILIDSPAEKIYNTLSNFNHWQAWSPWLIQDPEAEVNVAEDTKSYYWEGNRIGSGNMKITNEDPNQSLDCDLNFLKPWKSYAKVRFELTPKEEGTQVNWLMDSSLPFFLFWMKKTMTALIGMDYDRGLSMLKEYVEKGQVNSKLDFKGVFPYPGCTYVGIKTDCSLKDIGKKMEADLSSLGHFFEDKQELVDGNPFSIYHKWDVANGKGSYTSGVPVKSIPGQLPQGFVSGSIPATNVYTLSHQGPYHYLGNAWSTLYNMHQSKAIKINKKIHPFETYLNKPGETPENELVAEVHFPLK